MEQESDDEAEDVSITETTCAEQLPDERSFRKPATKKKVKASEKLEQLEKKRQAYIKSFTIEFRIRTHTFLESNG